MVDHEISSFAADVLERSRTVPVLVDFWAAWCGPCRVLGPVLERLEEQASGRWVLAKVDTDKHQDVAAEYGIKSIPAVKLFVDGKVTKEFVGALPERAIEQWLEKALPDPYRREIERAEELLSAGRDEDAGSVLKNVLVASPGKEAAVVLLARSLIRSNPARAVSLVAELDESCAQFLWVDAIRTMARLAEAVKVPATLPEGDAKETYLTAARELSAGNYEEALKCFIALIREQRYYDDDGGRKACIAIFKVLGDDHPLTSRYRREFSSALY